LVTNENDFKEKLRKLYREWLIKELNPKYDKPYQKKCNQILQISFLNAAEKQRQMDLAKARFLKDFDVEIQQHIANIETFDLENLRNLAKNFNLLYAPTITKKEVVDELTKRFNFIMKDKLFEIAEKNGYIIKGDKLKFEKIYRDVDQTNYVIQNPLDLYHLLRNSLFLAIKNYKSQEEKYNFFTDYKNFPKAFENNPTFIQIFQICRNIEGTKVDLKRLNQRISKSEYEEGKILEGLNINLNRLDSLLRKYSESFKQ
jgi:hypothetical protein